VPSSPPRSRPADSISRNDEVGEPVSGDVSNMEPASNPGCFYSFVAFDAGPMPGRVAVWLFGTVTDDVERTVAALEIGVAVAHVLGRTSRCAGKCQQRQGSRGDAYGRSARYSAHLFGD
jgi:hypothetical protein